MSGTVSLDEYMEARKVFVKSSPRGNMIMKAVASPPSWNDEKRSARFVMSAEVEDRDNDIIMQDGLDTLAFTKNPVALYVHNSWGLPLGQWSDVQKVAGRPKRTEGTCMFDPEGIDDDCDAVAAKVKIGTIRMASIGFIPRVINRRAEVVGQGRYPGYEILEAELVECSIVPIGANPMALAKDAGGMSRGTMLAMFEKFLDTFEMHPETGLIIPRKRYEEAYKEATGSRTTAVVEKTAESQQQDEVIVSEAAPEVIGQVVQPEPKDEKAMPAPEQQDEPLLTRIAKFLGVIKDPPKPEILSQEDKEAAISRADEALERVKRFMSA